jgi:hypothetical protein
MIPKETTMLRTKITKATLTILALFFTASASYSQDQKIPTYRVPGDDTVYTLPHSSRDIDATTLVPLANAAMAKPKAPDPISYFHLEFVIKAIDSGKVTSSRTYTMDANTTNYYHNSYRSDTSEGSSPILTNRNRTDIDCSSAQLVGTDSLALKVDASITSDLRPAPPADPMSANYTGSFYTLIPFGKPTVVFSADTQTPNRKIQMEVTATPIRTTTKP